MWTRRDLLALATAAVATFALTLGTFWARSAVATDAKSPATADVKTPTLNLGDIRVSAALSHDKPHTVLLSARNTSSQACTAHFRAAAMVSSASSAGSRSAPPATTTWSEGYTANLKPGEARQIAVSLPAAAFGTPATTKTRGSFAYLTLSTDDSKDSIQAITLRN